MKLSHYLPGRQVLFSSCVLWKSQTDFPFPSGPGDGFGSTQFANGLSGLIPNHKNVVCFGSLGK